MMNEDDSSWFHDKDVQAAGACRGGLAAVGDDEAFQSDKYTTSHADAALEEGHVP